MGRKAAGVRDQASESGSAAGGVAVEDRNVVRGILPGELDDIRDEETATILAKIELPVASLADAFDRASLVTGEQIVELKKSHQWQGGFHGAFDLGRSLHVNSKLSPEESDTLRQLAITLDLSNTRLANGTPVRSIADVFRWIMEQSRREIEERSSA